MSKAKKEIWWWFACGHVDIRPIEILRSSEKCVWLPGGPSTAPTRHAKLTDWGEYHPTWEDAHKAMVTYLERHFEQTETRLRQAQEEVDRVYAKLEKARRQKPPEINEGDQEEA